MTLRDQINIVVAAVLLTLTLAFLSIGCSGPVAWAPTTRSLTYHITGSAPGPKEYDELDTFVSIEALGKSNAYWVLNRRLMLRISYPTARQLTTGTLLS